MTFPLFRTSEVTLAVVPATGAPTTIHALLCFGIEGLSEHGENGQVVYPIQVLQCHATGDRAADEAALESALESALDAYAGVLQRLTLGEMAMPYLAREIVAWPDALTQARMA